MQSDLRPDRQAISGITIGNDDEYKYDASNTDFDERYGSFAGVSLSLESKTTLSFYIKTTRTIDSCVAELYDESQQYDCEVVSSGQYQIVRVNGITAKDLNKTVMLYLTFDNEPVHIGYCPLTYCYTVVNGGFDTSLKDVCKVLYCFHVAALEYASIH
ncbi:MAG: hypothetical protein K6A80_04310 [Saccharofermentans sp.]|nr:hypothetical protein [Saccharofermentans sp.]